MTSGAEGQADVAAVSQPAISGNTNVRPTTLFHSSAIQLRKGSVIEPGNWGRILRMYPHDCGEPGLRRITTDEIFEFIRQQNYRARPSRLRSCFAFTSLDDVARSRALGFGQFDVLYEVELVEPDAAWHIGDFGMVDHCFNMDMSAQGVEQRSIAAHIYWRSLNPTIPEFLTSSPLRIVSKLPSETRQWRQSLADCVQPEGTLDGNSSVSQT